MTYSVVESLWIKGSETQGFERDREVQGEGRRDGQLRLDTPARVMLACYELNIGRYLGS